MKLRILLPSVVLLALSGIVLAQTATVIVRRGQPVQGLGFNAGALEKLAVNDSGEWLVMMNTNNPDENADEVVVRNGFLTLQEGAIVGNPPGASIDEFGSLNIDEKGDSAWEFTLVDPNVISQANAGLYLDTKLVALSGDPLNTPGYGRTATWSRFVGITKHNNNNQILIGSQVNDPAIGGIFDDSIILLSLDDNQNVINSIDIAHEGGQVPQIGLSVAQNGLPFNQVTQMDLNDRGDVLWQAKMGAQNSSDRVILLNDQVLVRNGDASPVAGLNWNIASPVRLALNDAGDWLVQGNLTGIQNRRPFVAINNQILVRARETIPAISPFLLDNFATGTPLFLANTGEAIYRAQWTGPGATDTGLFLGKDLIVREGVTKLDNVAIDEFVDNEAAIATSPSGRFVLFECTLTDGANVIGFVDIGRMTPIPGCTPNEGKLRRAGGFPVVGGQVTFGMDDGQGIGVTPFLMISDRPIFTYPPCGLTTSFGELLIDFGNNGNPFLLQIGNPYLGVEVPIDIPIANNVLLIDRLLYAQGIFFDIANLVPGQSNLRLTNAIEMQIGAP